MLRVFEAGANAIGARLCYGEPARHGDRTVIPVAAVLTAGGLGLGSSTSAESPRPQEGGGGGGIVSARPIGFIEVTDDGARFRRIVTTIDLLQLVGGAAFVAARLTKARRSRRR